MYFFIYILCCLNNVFHNFLSNYLPIHKCARMFKCMCAHMCTITWIKNDILKLSSWNASFYEDFRSTPDLFFIFFIFFAFIPSFLYFLSFYLLQSPISGICCLFKYANMQVYPIHDLILYGNVYIIYAHEDRFCPSCLEMA